MNKQEFLKSAGKICKKIYYSLDAGAIIVGILLIFLCSLKSEKSIINNRGVIGEFLIVMGYMMFPLGSKKKKKSIFIQFIIHVFLSGFSVLGLLGSTQYYLCNIPENNQWYELCFSALLLLSCSYIVYIILSFSYTLYSLIKKALSYRIDHGIKEATSKIETVNRLIAAIAALIASLTPIILAVCALVKI